MEPLLIPSLINDIELKRDNATEQTIAQCLVGLYFTLQDNDQLHVELITINNATGQMQFINPELGKIFIKYRKMLYDIINDHLTRLNDVNHDKVKQQLLEQLEDLAVTINTGNVVPIIAPAEDDQNILASDNPYLTGNNFAFELDPQFDNNTIYEDMQKRIDELERENNNYENQILQLREDLNVMEVRQQVWEDLKKENDQLQEQVDNINDVLKQTEPVLERLKESILNDKEDQDPFKMYKEKQKKTMKINWRPHYGSYGH